jgi:hypothetical protein
MFGFKLVVQRAMCDVRFVRWRRTHRNNRIARKWHKKYGAVTSCRNDKAVRLGDMMVVCPCLHKHMVKVFEASPVGGNYSDRFTASQQFSSRHL